MTEYTFEATLQKPEIPGSWTYLVIPLNIEEIFGSKGQIKVRGTINGYPYRSSAMPSGDGTHYMVVKKEIRDKIHATQGSTVFVTMTQDQEERTVTLQDDFKNALESNNRAYTHFDTFSYSRQKEYIDWIEAAKTEATRLKRIHVAIEKISQGEPLK
jgi:hypothetical protein